MGWQASNDPSTTRPLQGREIGEWLRAGGSPYASRYSTAVADALSDVVTTFEPDVIIAGPLDVSPYVPLLRESAEHLVFEADQSERDLLLAIADHEENRPRALVRRLVAERAGQVEADTMALVDQIWVASDHEATRLRGRLPSGADVVTVPNVVNTDQYPLASRDRIGALVYPGLFAFPPNEEAARILVRQVMPLLPSMTLTLVGSGDLAWLRDVDRPQIQVTGPVPDIVPYLTSAWAMPIPLRSGGGTRLKAIEGLAVGLPIVSTSKGIEGLGLQADRDFLHADEPREFCAQVERLRDEPGLAEGLIRRGRSTVRARFSLEAATRSIQDALARLGTPA